MACRCACKGLGFGKGLFRRDIGVVRILAPIGSLACINRIVKASRGPFPFEVAVPAGLPVDVSLPARIGMLVDADLRAQMRVPARVGMPAEAILIAESRPLGEAGRPVGSCGGIPVRLGTRHRVQTGGNIRACGIFRMNRGIRANWTVGSSGVLVFGSLGVRLAVYVFRLSRPRGVIGCESRVNVVG